MTARTTGLFAAALVLVTAAAPAGACGNDLLAHLAVSDDPQQAEAAIAALREFGPAGLGTLLGAHARAIDAWDARPVSGVAPVPDPALQRLCAALDRVGAQRDNIAARLYWHTDLEKAKAAARETGRPILSLTLLGCLDEEHSCANSRFFRTVLYADRRIAEVLRRDFILHWESARPAPRITVDFGDGRSIVRTITGNSVHLVLDETGRPLDALPGLHSPGAFLAWLQAASALHGRYAEAARRPATQPEAVAAAILRPHHERVLGELLERWRSDLAAVGAPVETAGPEARDLVQIDAPAVEAMRLTVSKAMVEGPLLGALRPAAERLERETTGPTWERIALRHHEAARLDESSRRLMAAKAGADFSTRMVENLERAIALDTVRNEYLLHRRVHEWFGGGPLTDRASLVDRVYSELFLTPADDPWLGLLPADTYAALQGNGVRVR